MAVKKMTLATFLLLSASIPAAASFGTKIFIQQSESDGVIPVTSGPAVPAALLCKIRESGNFTKSPIPVYAADKRVGWLSHNPGAGTLKIDSPVTAPSIASAVITVTTNG